MTWWSAPRTATSPASALKFKIDNLSSVICYLNFGICLVPVGTKRHTGTYPEPARGNMEFDIYNLQFLFKIVAQTARAW